MRVEERFYAKFAPTILEEIEGMATRSTSAHYWKAQASVTCRWKAKAG
jgi:hypothetical protein